jgi:16S rRNA (uracil1498-N3)-methyltransferase
VHRVRIPTNVQPGETITLSDSEAHYVARVLRMLPGDVVEAFDGRAGKYRIRLTAVSAAGVCGQVVTAHQEASAASTSLVLGQALPKGARMDLVIEKCSELGLTTLVPVDAERTVVRLRPERIEERLARWRRVAEAAARQCRRSTLLEIQAPMSTAAFCSLYRDAPVKIVCWAGEAQRGLRHVLERVVGQHAVAVLIGPEGGWTDQEIHVARGYGFVTVHLGPRILRTETAAIAVTSILQYSLGALEPRKGGT